MSFAFLGYDISHVINFTFYQVVFATGVLVCWCVGVLVCWCVGVLAARLKTRK